MKKTEPRLLGLDAVSLSSSRLRGASGRAFFAATLFVLASACAPKTTSPGPAAPTATSDSEWEARTERLRPSGASSALDALAKAQKDPTTYALLADAYVESDAPVMSIFYGLYYRAMGTDCASDSLASLAIGRVLAQKIAVVEDAPGKLSYRSRLAASDIEPRTLEDGTRALPLASVSARSFESALPGFTGQGGLAEFSALLSRWADGVEPLGALDEFRTYLREVKKAGHLEAFSYLALGLAFEEEFRKYATTNEARLAAGVAYLDSHLFVPKATLRADDAVR